MRVKFFSVLASAVLLFVAWCVPSVVHAQATGVHIPTTSTSCYGDATDWWVGGSNPCDDNGYHFGPPPVSDCSYSNVILYQVNVLDSQGFVAGDLELRWSDGLIGCLALWGAFRANENNVQPYGITVYEDGGGGDTSRGSNYGTMHVMTTGQYQSTYMIGARIGTQRPCFHAAVGIVDPYGVFMPLVNTPKSC